MAARDPRVRLPILCNWQRWECRLEGGRIEAPPAKGTPANVFAGQRDDEGLGLWPVERAALRFADLRNAADCVSFATDFGFLGLAVHRRLARRPPAAWRRLVDAPEPGTPILAFLEAHDALNGRRRPFALSEAVDDWLREAHTLRAAMQVAAYAQGERFELGAFRALEGDAIRFLGYCKGHPGADDYAAHAPDGELPDVATTLADPEARDGAAYPLRCDAVRLLKNAMNPHLGMLRAQVGLDGEEATPAAVWVAPTLLSALWAGAWQLLASGQRVRECAWKRCRALLTPRRVDQRYCCKACERADAQQRWRDRQAK